MPRTQAMNHNNQMRLKREAMERHVTGDVHRARRPGLTALGRPCDACAGCSDTPQGPGLASLPTALSASLLLMSPKAPCGLCEESHVPRGAAGTLLPPPQCVPRPALPCGGGGLGPRLLSQKPWADNACGGPWPSGHPDLRFCSCGCFRGSPKRVHVSRIFCIPLFMLKLKSGKKGVLCT